MRYFFLTVEFCFFPNIIIPIPCIFISLFALYVFYILWICRPKKYLFIIIIFSIPIRVLMPISPILSWTYYFNFIYFITLWKFNFYGSYSYFGMLSVRNIIFKNISICFSHRFWGFRQCYTVLFSKLRIVFKRFRISNRTFIYWIFFPIANYIFRA